MALLYKDYDIESFEAGRGLWHARIRRADHEPVIIGGGAFPQVEIGFAWPDRDAAVADARNYIDHHIDVRDRQSAPHRQTAV